MSDINSIATGAVTNYQRALATVANNIANVDSEGYSRQEVTLAENTPTKFGKSFFGLEQEAFIIKIKIVIKPSFI